jgi:hypothetical protein
VVLVLAEQPGERYERGMSERIAFERLPTNREERGRKGETYE